MISGISSGTGLSVIQQLRQEMFALLDTNGDGKQEKSEVKSAFGKIFSGTGQSGNVDSLANKWFDELDTNKDGYVDETEMEAAMPQIGPEVSGMRPPMMPQMSQDMFAEIDTDDNGKHDKSEVTAAISARVSKTGGTGDVDSLVTKLFDDLDTNEDGYIDASEAAAAPKPPAGGQEMEVQNDSQNLMSLSLQDIMRSIGEYLKNQSEIAYSTMDLQA